MFFVTAIRVRVKVEKRLPFHALAEELGLFNQLAFVIIRRW